LSNDAPSIGHRQRRDVGGRGGGDRPAPRRTRLHGDHRWPR
jgi:hypothetical protein